MKYPCIGPSPLGLCESSSEAKGRDFVPEPYFFLWYIKPPSCVKSLCYAKSTNLGQLPGRCRGIKEVLLLNEWAFLDGKSVIPSRVEALHTLCIHCFLCRPGETAILRHSVFVTAMCTTLHKFLVVISTNISIQQSFSSCIQLMVGELFFLICIMAYECVIS